MKKLEELLTFPVYSDGYGCYIFDGNNKMLARVAIEYSTDELRIHLGNAFADALNKKYAHTPKRENFDRRLIRNGISLPVMSDGRGEYVCDKKGRELLLVRGWGWLRKHGEEIAEREQILIGDAFAKALNEMLPKN